MALIEGIRIQNYRALRDVTLGQVAGGDGRPLTPLTAVIGRNGVGKSTLFDAFSFIVDCLSTEVGEACSMKGRGGFERLRSSGTDQAIRFQISYREDDAEQAIHYEFSVAADQSGRPFLSSEKVYRIDPGPHESVPSFFLDVADGRGKAWVGDEPFILTAEEKPMNLAVESLGAQRLLLSSLGDLNLFPPMARLRDFLKGWYLSYFQPSAARGLPAAGPQKHLNMQGDNIGNVVQYLEREHRDRFDQILQRIAEKIPGVKRIDAKVTDDQRVLLRFDDSAFHDPFYAQQMSDGTLKVFAYLLLLEDPDPPPFICIEEPENGLYHKLLESLAREFRSHATGEKSSSQVFVTTHQPYFVDALAPEEVWILEKGEDGYSKISRVSGIPVVKAMVDQGLSLGSLWYSDYLDAR